MKNKFQASLLTKTLSIRLFLFLMKALAKFHVGFANGEFTKMYPTFRSLDGVLSLGHGRDFHTKEYRVWASRKF